MDGVNMTTAFLLEEFRKTLDRLKKTDPGTQEYHMTLHSLECLNGLGQEINSAVLLVARTLGYEGAELSAPAPAGEQVQAEAGVTQFPGAKTAPAEEPATEPGKTVKAYSRADLRKVLMKAKKSGVNLNDIFEQYGASGVNDIPESYYAEIIQRFGGV